MSDLSKRLRQLIDIKNFSLAQCARICKLNRSQVYQILNGEVKNPQLPTLKKIIDGFGCDPDWLKTGKGEPFPKEQTPEPQHQTRETRLANLVHVPILGKVPAGFPQTVEENIESYATLPGVPSNCFALRVIGESMEPGIKHGDYVLFVNDREARPGDIVVVNDEFGESMIKRLKEKDDEFYLVSDNPAYPTVRPNGDYRIMGVVIGGWRELKIR
ncbi:MAG: XRE family transcriptional regulator [Desulfobulbaceae bacterium]|nr:XRE family transcriptional regulator [Desulfobulbaceae bacterium]